MSHLKPKGIEVILEIKKNATVLRASKLPHAFKQECARP